MSYTRVVPRPSVATAILPAVEVSFRLVDVFTPVPFAGNQLCVVPDPPVDLDATTMQALAQEIGLSETTFVTGVRSGGYDVRIFTPDAELPFAGHPTLGTAFTLASEDRVGAHVVQTSAAGDVPVDVDLRGAWRGWSSSRRRSATSSKIEPRSRGQPASSRTISSTGCPSSRARPVSRT